ncbi:unnamed protein product [Ixodes persulcatus]
MIVKRYLQKEKESEEPANPSFGNTLVEVVYHEASRSQYRGTMQDTSGHHPLRRHHSVPNTGEGVLHPRTQVNSTPKNRKRPRDDSCFTDPIPRRAQRTAEPEPAYVTPVRPSSRASSAATGDDPTSSLEVKQLSFVSGNLWSFQCSPGSPHVYGRLNVTSSSGPICRICHEGDQAGPLSSHCACSGTMGLTHVPCLERWLSTRNTDMCELCQKRFPTVQTRRSLKEWIRGPGHQKRALFGDLMCFVVLSPIAFFGLELSVQGASSQATTRHVWQAGSLIMLSCLLLSAFVIWTCTTVKYHYRNFRDWQNVNMKMTLVSHEDATRVNLSPSVA